MTQLSLVPNQTDAYSVPARMVHEIALGSERANVVAARFGYDDLAYFALLQQPVFQRLLDAKRAELAQDGSYFRYKSAMLAEANLDFFAKLVHDPNTPANVRIELHKILMRGGRLDANPDEKGMTVNAGQGATINIIHPGAVKPPPRPRTEITVENVIDPRVIATNNDLNTEEEVEARQCQ
jgi:hypothetical protein